MIQMAIAPLEWKLFRGSLSPLQGLDLIFATDPGASLRFAPGYYISRLQRENKAEKVLAHLAKRAAHTQRPWHNLKSRGQAAGEFAINFYGNLVIFCRGPSGNLIC
jgi:hypothetical protein